MNSNNNFSIVKYYDNAELDKDLILKQNFRKAGVFMWTHKETGRRYIGCSHKLSRYLSSFYPDTTLHLIFPNLHKPKNIDEESSRIRKDILLYGHSQFSLSILIYLDRGKYETNKSLYSRTLLERQKFIVLIKPEYNKFKGK